MWYHLAMAGIQVLRIESRRTLDGALVDHIAGTTRPETARKVPEPVVALGGVGLEAGRAVINEHRPRGRGRPPHHAVEFVLGGAPPYGSDPWDKEREREFADACYEWACGVLGPRSVIVSAALHRDETSPHVHVLAVPIDSTGALRWKGVRDEAADQLGVPRRGRKLAGAYRAFQDSFHAGVGRPFGLGRGEVGSKAKHEQIDRAKAAELRRDEAEQAADAADERATESRELLGRRDELREEAAELLGGRLSARAETARAESELKAVQARLDQARAVAAHVAVDGRVLDRLARQRRARSRVRTKMRQGRGAEKRADAVLVREIEAKETESNLVRTAGVLRGVGQAVDQDRESVKGSEEALAAAVAGNRARERGLDERAESVQGREESVQGREAVVVGLGAREEALAGDEATLAGDQARNRARAEELGEQERGLDKRAEGVQGREERVQGREEVVAGLGAREKALAAAQAVLAAAQARNRVRAEDLGEQERGLASQRERQDGREVEQDQRKRELKEQASAVRGDVEDVRRRELEVAPLERRAQRWAKRIPRRIRAWARLRRRVRSVRDREEKVFDVEKRVAGVAVREAAVSKRDAATAVRAGELKDYRQKLAKYHEELEQVAEGAQAERAAAVREREAAAAMLDANSAITRVIAAGRAVLKMAVILDPGGKRHVEKYDLETAQAVETASKPGTSQPSGVEAQVAAAAQIRYSLPKEVTVSAQGAVVAVGKRQTRKTSRDDDLGL